MNTATSVIAWLCVAVTVVAVCAVGWAAYRIVRVIRLGAIDPGRSNEPKKRLATMARETLGHTRMLKRPTVGAAHWFVFIAFGALLLTLVEAYGELFDVDFRLPIIGDVDAVWAGHGAHWQRPVALDHRGH